jgi:hypothetical protein
MASLGEHKRDQSAVCRLFPGPGCVVAKSSFILTLITYLLIDALKKRGTLPGARGGRGWRYRIDRPESTNVQLPRRIGNGKCRCRLESGRAMFRVDAGTVRVECFFSNYRFWNGSFHAELPFVFSEIEGMIRAGFRDSNGE